MHIVHKANVPSDRARIFDRIAPCKILLTHPEDSTLRSAAAGQDTTALTLIAVVAPLLLQTTAQSRRRAIRSDPIHWNLLLFTLEEAWIPQPRSNFPEFS